MKNGLNNQTNFLMDETYSTALTLLTVGMITVFSVLALVVFFGQLLIRVVNNYFPENTPTTKNTSLPSAHQSNISSDKLAAIVAAVNHFTNGQGSITEIKKLD